jgi:hypothetical protein
MGNYYSTNLMFSHQRCMKIDVYSQSSFLTINVSEPNNGYSNQNSFMIPIDQIIDGIGSDLLIKEILKRGLFESIKDYKAKA